MHTMPTKVFIGREGMGKWGGGIERITNMPVCLFRGAAGKELEWVELVS